MNKHQVTGRIEEAKGTVKEAMGALLDDKKMEQEGNMQKNLGKVEAGAADLKENVKNSV